MSILNMGKTNMRYLLIAVIAGVVLPLVFTCFPGLTSSKQAQDAGRSYGSDFGQSYNPVGEDSVLHQMYPYVRQPQKYYGDTLCQYDNKTVFISYEKTSLLKDMGDDGAVLITLENDVPVDTCILGEHSGMLVEADQVKIIVSADTLTMPLRYLPSRIETLAMLTPEKCRRHHLYREFALSDSSWNCEFSFTAWLPENPPGWIRQFIAIMLRNDIQAMYLDNKGDGRVINEYYGVRKIPKKVDGIDASNMSPEAIAEHFFEVDRRLYMREFGSDEELEGHGPRYNYSMTVSPVWMSRDGELVTYRFHTHYYTMGLHGFPEEYYLTFNNVTGKLLGWKDLFSESAYKEGLSLLEEQMTEYKHGIMEFEGSFSVSLEEANLSSNASEVIKEVYKDKYYPRPALTRNGLVFSYQPYEKGGFWEGILHFVIPFSKVNLKVPVK